MISLKIQLYIIIFSFLFGLFFAINLNFSAKYLYSSKKRIKFFSTALFVFFHVLVYFIGIRKISDGILHPYSILTIFLGYLSARIIQNKIVIKKK